MIAVSTAPLTIDAAAIPNVTRQEAYELLVTALERFLKVVDSLEPGDWHKPTACTEWNVRDMLAHQAGSYAQGASLRELVHQLSGKPKPGQLPEDVVNEIQLKDRAGKTPAELIAEVRKYGPITARNWAFGNHLMKLVSIPHEAVGSLSLRYLMEIVHSRDTWMHRLDICRATNRPFEQTAEHDGRIAALVMRDVAAVLARKFNGPALVFDLTGIAGGTWKIGPGEPVATIRMDVLDFNYFASGRTTFAQARAQATITGDVATAERALQQILVLY